MNQMELEPETRSVLDRIRHSSKVLSIPEMPADSTSNPLHGSGVE